MDLAKEKIQEVMKKKNITYAKLGQRLGMSRQGAHIIVFQGNPKYKTLIKLAKALRVSPKIFF